MICRFLTMRYAPGCFAILLGFAIFFTELPAQTVKADSVQRHFTTKPTRKQILAMKFEELSALSLAELTELSTIVGVSSVDELLKLLVHTASKTNEALNDAPGVVSVITAREIELFGAQTLKDALHYIVSVNFGTNFLYPDNLNVRGEQSPGLTNTHILLLMNGRPLRETLIAGVYTELLAGFPITAIDRIELVRGPGSVLYGSGAFTATVNIITKQTFPLTMSLRGGSFDTYTASAQGGTTLKTGLGNLRLNLAGYYYNRSGWSIPFTTQIGNRRETNVYTPSRQTFSGLLTLELDNFSAQTIITSFEADVLGVTPLFPTITHSILSITSDVGYKQQFANNLTTSVNGTVKHYQSKYESKTNAQDLVLEATTYWTPNSTVKALIGGVLNGRYGSIVSSSNNSTVVPQYHQLWLSAYAEFQWQVLEEIKFSAGLQANKPPNTPLDIVPRFNLIWNVTPEFGFKILFGRAYRAPTAFELFLDGSVGVGNPNLRPEHFANWDIETFWETSQFRFSMTYYNGTQTDNIILIRQSNRSIPQNQGRFFMEGIELEGKITPFDELYLLGSALFQRNILNSTSANTVSSPDVTIKVGCGYDNQEGIAASIFYTYTGQQGNTIITPTQGRPITNPIPGRYHVVSANLNLSITKLLNLSTLPDIIFNARVENILNESLWASEISGNTNSLPLAPGRGLYAGLIVKF